MTFFTARHCAGPTPAAQLLDGTDWSGVRDEVLAGSGGSSGC